MKGEKRMNDTVCKPLKLKDIYGKDKNFFRLLLILAGVFVLCSVLKPELFLTGANFQSIAKQFPEYGLLSIGIGLALLTGGIDLSVVNIANLSSISAALFMLTNTTKDMPDSQVLGVVIAAIVIAVGVGLGAGAINGLLISKIGIPPILATLGTQQLYWGIAIVMTQGRSVSGLPSLYSKVFNANLGGVIPVPLVIFILCAVLMGVVLSRTKFGSRLYLLGSNSTAAKYAGLKTSALLVKTYALSGLMAVAAGIIMMAKQNSAKADYGSAYTLQCVLVAVLGGVSTEGGKGNIQGIVVAAIILQFLSSCLNMYENISNFYRDIIWGVVLIAALIFNYMINKRDQKKAQG